MCKLIGAKDIANRTKETAIIAYHFQFLLSRKVAMCEEPSVWRDRIFLNSSACPYRPAISRVIAVAVIIGATPCIDPSAGHIMTYLGRKM